MGMMAQLTTAGLEPTPQQVKILAADESQFCPIACMCFCFNCVRSCLGKVCKKICLCFEVKDVADTASTLLHAGWLVAYALQAEHLTKESIKEEIGLREVRKAILRACDE